MCRTLPGFRASVGAVVLSVAVLSPAAAQDRSGQSGSAAAVAVTSAPGALVDLELKALRAATAKYLDVNAALADGYIRDPLNHCITSTAEGSPSQLGAMGVHYFRPDLLGLAGAEPRVHGTGMHMDFLRPAVLIYEPQQDGSQELVAIENLVWANAWRDAGHTEAPRYQGNEFYYMHDNPETAVDEAHGFEPHYELHLWLYRDNPQGLMAQFNTTVSCLHHR